MARVMDEAETSYGIPREAQWPHGEGAGVRATGR